MKIAGKTLNMYFVVSKNFLAVIFIIMIYIVILRLSSDALPVIQTLLSLSVVIVLIWAGWSSVKHHGLDLRQVLIVGLLLSFGIHWSLPIFHSPGEVLYLIFINTIVYSIIAIFGGWLAKMSAQQIFWEKK
jgi:hypothetical protein